MSSTAVFPITQGIVIATNPDTNSVQVMIRDGQGLAYPVPVLIPGPCDALRIKQNPLPGRGTLGIIAFTNNDIRSAVWLGAIPGGIPDAISNPTGDPFLDYQAHWSGYWHSLDSGGNENTCWPDGSTMMVGSGFTPTRHIQNAAGQREAVPVADTDRPAKSTPMPFTFTHSTGTTVSIDVSGDVTVNAVGNITAVSAKDIYATATTAMDLTAPTITLDGSSEIYLTTPEVMVSQNMTVAGNLTVDGDATSTTGTISAETLKATSAATGTFTAESGQTITVVEGIVTEIS